VAAAHVLVTPSGTELGLVDGWLSLHGHTRNIMAIVNHFVDALRIVAESDLLTSMPHGFIKGYARGLMAKHGLAASALPFETEKLLYKMIWHERLHTHPAHQWLRSVVADICGAPSLSPANTATRLLGGDERQR
jgi:DNA-binding transcriptional LysR family regulator